MSGFKIGDKVVCVDGSSLKEIQAGNTYTIKYVNGSIINGVVGLEENPYTWYASRFILAKKPNGVNDTGTPIHFALEDLQDWMKIVMKDGRSGIVRTGNNLYGTCILYTDGGGFDKIYDIESVSEVYIYNQSWGLLMHNYPINNNLLWKQQTIVPIKTPQQIAIEELEASIRASQDKLTALKGTL